MRTLKDNIENSKHRGDATMRKKIKETILVFMLFVGFPIISTIIYGALETAGFFGL